jgi:hypothetical protein
LEELVRDEDERGWMEPRVGMLLGGDSAAEFERDELFAAWRRFFERVSDRAPTVLLFEDLQWADPSLLDFIEHLATWTRDHPILIVGVSRPELLDRRPGWGAGFGRFTALHLERLTDAAMRELLAGRAPDLPEDVIGQVLERAGGVPLYAVEVARAVADHKRKRDRGGQPGRLDVPESLHGLIAARIDALPAAERALLLAAAVLGRRFAPDALAAVARADASATRSRTESLVRRELLAIDKDRAPPGRGGGRQGGGVPGAAPAGVIRAGAGRRGRRQAAAASSRGAAARGAGRDASARPGAGARAHRAGTGHDR